MYHSGEYERIKWINLEMTRRARQGDGRPAGALARETLTRSTKLSLEKHPDAEKRKKRLKKDDDATMTKARLWTLERLIILSTASSINIYSTFVD